MRKQNRSCSLLATAKSRYHFDTNKIIKSNKRGYSAEGYSLLTSALRPRLFGSRDKNSKKDKIFSISFNKNDLLDNQDFDNGDARFELGFSIKFGIVILFALFLGTTVFRTNNASAFSITLSVPSSVSLNVNPSTNNGFGESSTGSITIKTDSPAGYKLQLGSKSNGTNELVNSSSSSSKLTSITANTTSDNFKNSGTVNTWGYKPSKLNGSANTNYIKAPSGSSSDILDTTSAANSTDNTYSLGIAAKVNSSTVAGTYTNTFVLTATANTLSYSITYNLNSGTWTEDTNNPNPQTGNTTAETVTISSVTPTKSGYTFKGWCSSSSITNNNTTSAPSCSGTTYQPSGTYNLTSANNTLNLYAMWQENGRSYTINYYSNVGSPSNMPSTQTGSAASTNSYQVTLSSNTPTLSGYTFQGWCTNSTSTESCSGTTYQPSASITISSNGYTLNLYAMWKADKPASCSGTIPASPNATFGGKRWTTTSVTCNWEDAKKVCPSGYHLPSYSEFQYLRNNYSNGATLNSYGWPTGSYWSSTEVDSSCAHYMNVTSSSAYLNGYNPKTSSYYVRCVAG